MTVAVVRKLRWIFLALLLIVGPFHAFLVTWLKFEVGSGMAGIFALWREVAVTFIVGSIFIEKSIKKEKPVFDLLDWLIVGYSLLALAWLPFQIDNLPQWLLGVRFDVMPLVFLVALRQASAAPGDWRKLKKYALGAGCVVVIFGVAHALFLPRDFLTHFGYSLNQNPYTPEVAISGCQFLEHVDIVCRATSTFGGPTRYGTYLLVLAGLLLPCVVVGKNVLPKILMVLVVGSMILTYSRSVWIGFMVMMLIGVIWAGFYFKSNRVAAMIIVIEIILALGGVAFINMENPDFIQTIFLRESSSGEHLQYFKDGLAAVGDAPFGRGLGTAGPASVRFEKFLTENWFLQIAVEMGVLGALLFIGIVAAAAQKLFARKDPAAVGLALSLVGMCVTGFFTHSFEETTAVLIWVIFAGEALTHLKHVVEQN